MSTGWSKLTIDCESDGPILTIGRLARLARDEPGQATTVCNINRTPPDPSDAETLTTFRRGISEIIYHDDHKSLNAGLAKITYPLLCRPITISFRSSVGGRYSTTL